VASHSKDAAVLVCCVFSFVEIQAEEYVCISAYNKPHEDSTAKGEYMYEIIYDLKITMEDLSSDVVYTGTVKDWINYLAGDSRSILDNLQISGNDGYGELFDGRRPYIFYDENGRIYDPRLWSGEIEKRRLQLYRERHLPKRNDSGGIFRRDPVRGTCHKRLCKGAIYSRTQHIGECRKSADTEYAWLVRHKRSSHTLRMVLFYSDYRNKERSWKRQRKTRHQWKPQGLSIKE